MLQGLERADGRTELLSRLQILERRIVGVLDGADGFRTEKRGRVVDHLFDQRESSAFLTDQRAGRHMRILEENVGGAQLVDGAIGPHRNAGGSRVDDEYADTVRIGIAPRGARRDDQLVGARGVGNDPLFSGYRIALARRPGPGCNMREVVARAIFRLRERQLELATDDGWQ